MKKIILLAVFCTQAMGYLSEESVTNCLGHDFKLKVAHDVLPLGFLSKELSVVKKKCDIKIKSVSYIWIKKEWNVDVCRTPVHIKAGTYSPEVLRKSGPCPNKTSGYCKAAYELIGLIEDDGLIFAKGEKEDPLSEHGQIYCAYALLNKYLKNGEILSRYENSGPYRPKVHPSSKSNLKEERKEKREEKKGESIESKIKRSPPPPEILPKIETKETLPVPSGESL